MIVPSKNSAHRDGRQATWFPLRGLLAVLAVLPGGPLAADAGPTSREQRTAGALLQLTPLAPDQSRAFFIGRGLPRDAVETYAAACAFMAIVKNEASASAVSYRLGEWRARQGAKSYPLKRRQDWLAPWEAQGVPQAALIAFEWSQLPDEQSFETNDWNQGMTSIALPHGAVFDLDYQWHIAGKVHRATLKGVRCADANG